jgi:hypothetical protein
MINGCDNFVDKHRRRPRRGVSLCIHTSWSNSSLPLAVVFAERRQGVASAPAPLSGARAKSYSYSRRMRALHTVARAPLNR